MKYKLFWVSPKGLADEGEYLYGEADSITRDRTFLTAEVAKLLSAHRTLEGAKFTAETHLKRQQIPFRGRIGDLKVSLRKV